MHPKTAYDQMSTVASANDSDEEADMDDIKRAQKLSCSMSGIISTPESHRAIRMIYRGDYNKIVQQAEEEHHRLRKYLVASDLSDESTHALEWAIGTVLRDGDTLLCIYCVDEETGIGGVDNSVPDDPKAMREQAAAINTVASSRSAAPSMSAVPDFVRNSIRGDSSKNNTPNTSPAPSSRGERGRAEEERRRAVKEITDKVLRLLRKTTLQVRVIVEVLHCKNPKHLITEVIDHVNPTLVVIGSRGRSALKGYVKLSDVSTIEAMTAANSTQCHSGIIFQLSGDEELGPCDGGTKASPKAGQIQRCEACEQSQQPSGPKFGQRQN